MEKTNCFQGGAFPSWKQCLPICAPGILKALCPRKVEVLENIVNYVGIFLKSEWVK